jgi:hypothetical protein
VIISDDFELVFAQHELDTQVHTAMIDHGGKTIKIEVQVERSRRRRFSRYFYTVSLGPIAVVCACAD